MFTWIFVQDGNKKKKNLSWRISTLAPHTAFFLLDYFNDHKVILWSLLLFSALDITSTCLWWLWKFFTFSSSLTAGRRVEEGGGKKESSRRAAALWRGADGAGEEGAGGEREKIPWEREADWRTQASPLPDMSEHLYPLGFRLFFH